MSARQKSPAPAAGTAAPPVENGRAAQISEITKAFRIIFRTIQEHSRQVEAQCGVSAAQLWAMWELFSAPGLSVSELAGTLGIHASTTSNMLDKLEKKGLVRRERTGVDQRVVRLNLTDEGALLLAHSPRPAQGALSEALLHQTDAVLESLCATLSKVIESLPGKDAKAALVPIA